MFLLIEFKFILSFFSVSILRNSVDSLVFGAIALQTCPQPQVNENIISKNILDSFWSRFVEKHSCVSFCSLFFCPLYSWKLFFSGVLTQFTSCILFTEDGVGFVGGIANWFSSFENVNHSVSSFQLTYNVAACLMAALMYFIANYHVDSALLSFPFPCGVVPGSHKTCLGYKEPPLRMCLLIFLFHPGYAF